MVEVVRERAGLLVSSSRCFEVSVMLFINLECFLDSKKPKQLGAMRRETIVFVREDRDKDISKGIME